VVPSFISCGSCWYCRHDQFSLCDNTNPNWAVQEPLLGYPTAGIYGYTHAFGGYAGSHAQYVRVPHADVGCFRVPDGVSDVDALFVSDAATTGFMGADFCAIEPGATVAVWGAGGVGLMAMQSALLLGAGRVIAVEPEGYRRDVAARFASDTIDPDTEDVVEALRDLTGGRGPDACIDAVGMEAGGGGLEQVYDRVKQALRLETDRGNALRQAILACRKGGVLSILGVYGVMDKFPIGVLMNKGITVRTAQQHGQHYAGRLLEAIADGSFTTGFLATHPMPLESAVDGYDMFKHKTDGILRAVFTP
jgi:threonine dehydrogenase-like Zn-dependent dehydrogenase